MKKTSKGASVLVGVFSAFVASAPSTEAKLSNTLEAASGTALSPAAAEAIKTKAGSTGVRLAKKKFARVRTEPGGPWTQWKGQSAKPRPSK